METKKGVLKEPDGQPVFEAEAVIAHRVIDVYELYAEGKVRFATPHGSLTFKENRFAANELRDFVEAGHRSDTEYRTHLKGQALRSIPLGLAMFFIAGGLFGLYCWYASWAPDPPPGHWIRWFGWLIHGVSLILLGIALAGPFLCYFGLRQWLRVRRVERAAAGESQNHA